jgi:predicted nucleotidyltransferase
VVPEFDYESAREFLRQKERRRQKLLDARFARAWEDFHRIAETIWQKYHPDAIYQWGSLLDRNQFSEISDIDIALEGRMTAERYFALLADTEGMTDLPLDIVELAKVHPAHAEAIRTRGRRVYG